MTSLLTLLLCLVSAEYVFASSAAPGQLQGPAVPAAADILDIKEIIPLAHGYPQWYWLVGSAVLALLLTGLFLYIKKKRPGKHKIMSAHEKAFKALESVRSLMTPEQSREYAIRMADILRQYIEDRFQLSLYNLTTREFLHKLATNPDLIPLPSGQNEHMLKDWMNHCDLVKFAGYTLTAKEMEAMYSSVAEFITATQAEVTTNE